MCVCEKKKKNERGERNNYQPYRNTTDYEGILWIMVCQQIRQPKWNGQIPRKAKTDSTKK